jgi:hypothetical protein
VGLEEPSAKRAISWAQERSVGHLVQPRRANDGQRFRRLQHQDLEPHHFRVCSHPLRPQVLARKSSLAQCWSPNRVCLR